MTRLVTYRCSATENVSSLIGAAEIRAERHKFQRGFAALGDEAEIALAPVGR
ncbi:MAG: hypothetical protein ACLSTO_05030 [Bilophila wadsworthia]